jgi:cyclase
MNAEPILSSVVSRRKALQGLITLGSGAALVPFLGSESFGQEGSSGTRIVEATGNPGVDKNLAAFEAAPLSTTKLGDRLALLSGPGGNMLLLAGLEVALLVDTGIHPTAAAVATAVEAFAGKPVREVINTHWHFDHTGGNEFFGSHGARLVAHDNTRARMSHDQPIEAFNYVVPASPSIALPALTFPDRLTVYFGGMVLHLQHVEPAHTDGDILVNLPESNVLHTGDIFFNGIYPAIDYSTDGWIGGMVAAEERALALCDGQTSIIPGHGPLGTVTDLKAAREMLATIQGRIEHLLEAGKGLDEVVAAAPTRDFDERWGKGLYDGAGFTRLATLGIVRHRQKTTMGKPTEIKQ